MKKFWRYFLFLFVVFCVVLIIRQKAPGILGDSTQEYKIAINPASVDSKTGDIISVTIDITGPQKLGAFTAKVQYDEKVLEAVSCTSSHTCNPNAVIEDKHMVVVTNAKAEGFDLPMTAATLRFHVIGKEGSSSSLTMQGGESFLADTEGNILSTVSIVNGAIVVPSTAKSVTVNSDTPKVAIDNSASSVTITVPQSVSNATLDVGALLTSDQGAKKATIQGDVNVNMTTSLGGVTIKMPGGITIVGPSDWNGSLALPTVVANTTVTAPAPEGKKAVTSSVIEVGLGDTPVTFDKGVRLLIPGQANQLVGYSRGGAFTTITTNCSADSQSAGDALPVNGDCWINSAPDLVVWTKHFTKFVTYSLAATSQNTSSGGGSSNSQASAPVCNASKPGSAPKLISATAISNNAVTLTWSQASDPVTYYLVAYGTKSGSMQYGNPNIGGRDTRQYTIYDLSGNTTYYFRVRAGNNCMPGDFSNEIAVAVPSGIQTTTGTPDGFTKEDVEDIQITEAAQGTLQSSGFNKQLVIKITVFVVGLGIALYFLRKFVKGSKKTKNKTKRRKR